MCVCLSMYHKMDKYFPYYERGATFLYPTDFF